MAVLATGLTAGPASAQWFITPQAGGHFGGDTEDAKLNVGTGIGFISEGGFGFEFDFGYSPDYFDADNDFVDFDSTGNLTTAMFNLMATAPRSNVWRPYATGGVGWIRTHLDDVEDFFEPTNNEFGFNVGGGLMGQFSEHVGWRTDLRYIRALVDDEPDNEFDVSVGDFDLWRANFGVAFTF
jgi:opacity protein-like surface antigen